MTQLNAWAIQNVLKNQFFDENSNVTKLGSIIKYCIFLQQPQIVLLKEGTDTSQGKPQLISNINACQMVVDAVRTTLGPRGMVI